MILENHEYKTVYKTVVESGKESELADDVRGNSHRYKFSRV